MFLEHFFLDKLIQDNELNDRVSRGHQSGREL